MPGLISIIVQPICCDSDGAKRCMISSENVRKEAFYIHPSGIHTAKIRTDNVGTRFPAIGYRCKSLRQGRFGDWGSCRRHRVLNCPDTKL